MLTTLITVVMLILELLKLLLIALVNSLVVIVILRLVRPGLKISKPTDLIPILLVMGAITLLTYIATVSVMFTVSLILM